VSTIGPQLQAIYGSRIKRIMDDAVAPFASAVAEQMKENTKAGRAFGNDHYDDRYTPKYSKWRTRRGLQPQPTVMRAKSLRIERTTNPVTDGDAVEVGFVDGGKIFKYHHDGIVYSRVGLRMRSIFPKEWTSVPRDMYDAFMRKIIGVMRGQP